MVVECAPCPTCADIAHWRCLRSCRQEVTVTPVDGSGDVIVEDAVYTGYRQRNNGGFAFVSGYITWKLHVSQYPLTSPPPSVVTDGDGVAWTITDFRRSAQHCLWRLTGYSMAIEQDWGSIQVGTMDVSTKDANGFIVPAITWADAPGKIVSDGGFRSYENTQQHVLDQVEVYLDPAQYPLGTDWSLLRFRASATSTEVYRYESANQPEAGEPLVIRAEATRDGS